MKNKLILVLAVVLVLAFAAVGCTPKQANKPDNTEKSTEKTSEEKAPKEETKEEVVLKVGATPVPHADLLEFVKPILAEQGIKLEITEFTDYVIPNMALDSKEIDANYFQHVPYMESFAKENNLKLENAGGVHIEPMGIYSVKIKDIKDIVKGSKVSIPNDPTNGGRALILLEKAGLIKLKEDAGLSATEVDIVENPLELEVLPIDAAQLPTTLEDVTIAVINSNYALEANLNPVKDSLVLEDSNSPYVNIVTVREGDSQRPEIKALVDALQSQKTIDYIKEKYNGAIVPAK